MARRGAKPVRPKSVLHELLLAEVKRRFQLMCWSMAGIVLEMTLVACVGYYLWASEARLGWILAIYLPATVAVVLLISTVCLPSRYWSTVTFEVGLDDIDPDCRLLSETSWQYIGLDLIPESDEEAISYCQSRMAHYESKIAEHLENLAKKTTATGGKATI